MKRVISALSLALLAASASAFELVVTPALPGTINLVGAFDVTIAGFTPANGVIGSLSVTDGPATVTYTYLGKEAGFSNGFFNLGGSTSAIADSDAVGTSSQQANVDGALSFSFNTFGVTTVSNGTASLPGAPTFAIFDGGNSPYDFIIAYGDGTGDQDFDDMVLGVTAAIPEPETYALLLAGLGVVGFVARRRRPV